MSEFLMSIPHDSDSGSPGTIFLKATDTDVIHGPIIREGRSQLDEIWAGAAEKISRQWEPGHQIGKKAEGIDEELYVQKHNFADT